MNHATDNRLRPALWYGRASQMFPQLRATQQLIAGGEYSIMTGAKNPRRHFDDADTICEQRKSQKATAACPSAPMRMITICPGPLDASARERSDITLN